MKHPKPIRFSPSEGGQWLPFEYRGSQMAAHAIMFDDGSVFDMVNGWRPFQYCACCGQRLPKVSED